jgi:hypothetical protein
MNAYAVTAGVAGVSALALVQPADAKIIYTPAHMKIGATTFLDLNHDGVNDFRFVWTHSSRCEGRCTSTGMRPASAFDSQHAKLAVYGSGSGNQDVGQAESAALLRPGTPIGFNRQFPGGNEMVRVWAISGAIEEVYGPWKASTWSVGNIKDGYLGLKFVVNGKTHYGWARVTVKIAKNGYGVPSIDALISGYAFETEEKKPIRAGQESEDVISSRTTHPSAQSDDATAQVSLGSLAQGVVGLVAWRREELEVRAEARSVGQNA